MSNHDEIINRHSTALLSELRANGIPAIGLAGGVMLAERAASGGSMCHTFYVVDTGAVPEGTDTKFDLDAFVYEVARIMLNTKHEVVKITTPDVPLPPQEPS